MKERILHAWYSPEAAALGYGTTFYKREDGTEVEVTCVGEEADLEWYKWPDKQYLGLVVRYSRPGQRPLWLEESLSMGDI